MMRAFLSLPVLAAGLLAGLAATGAAAAPALEDAGRGEPARAAEPGAVLLAQDVDFEVYYDGDGNRVLVDPYTGKVVAIQPPRQRLDRRAIRRQLRMRELGRAPVEGDRYYLDDPDDMARFRRRFRDDGIRVIPPDEYDPYGNPDAFPEAPRDYGNAYPDDQGGVMPGPVERQPLDQAAIEPQEPDGADGQTEAAPPAPKIDDHVVINPSLSLGSRQDIAALQVLLDRAGASPGVIDGRFGSNVDKALLAYREITGTQLKTTDAAAIKEALAASGGDAFASYTITPEDAAGPYVASVPEDYSDKAKLDRLGYTSVTEAIAERFHMDESYLKALNPDADFDRPGTVIKVANFGQLVSTPVANIIADKARKQVRAYDESGKLVAAYPATIGSTDTPSPSGTHAVSRVAFDPNYTYNPKVNFKQGNNDKVLTIPPGPNGPVGSIWIALDKPTYGIHGTPEPSKIGKTESHGCVRLTNWDARELAKIVKAGVTVEFVD